MGIEDLMPEFKEKWPNAFNANVKPGGGTPPNGRPTKQAPQGDLSPKDMIMQGIEQLRSK